MRGLAAPSPLGYHVPPLAVADARPAGDSPAARAGTDRAAVPGEAAAKAAGSRPDPARDPYALIGPTPAFEANVLDTRRTVEVVLARMKTERAHEEAAKAMAGTDAKAAPESDRAAASAAKPKVETAPAPAADGGEAAAAPSGPTVQAVDAGTAEAEAPQRDAA